MENLEKWYIIKAQYLTFSLDWVSAKTLKGGSLPSYIVFDSQNYRFTVEENLKVKKETIDILVIGSLPNGMASS
jgi:hypothetical protein